MMSRCKPNAELIEEANIATQLSDLAAIWLKEAREEMARQAGQESQSMEAGSKKELICADEDTIRRNQ